MSSEVINPTELLSAYLADDVTQDERGAVERLIAQGVIPADEVSVMRETISFLKIGDRVASADLQGSLQRTIGLKLDEKRIKTLVGVSVTGDLTEKERGEVQSYLSTHPADAGAQRQAAALALLLNAGKVNADAKLLGRLRENLTQQLPAGAMPAAKQHLNGHVPTVAPAESATKEPEPQSTHASTSQRPSLRVFVKPENQWKKHAGWLSGVAALLAIGTGVFALWLRPGKTGPVAQQPGNSEEPAPKNPGNELIVPIAPHTNADPREKPAPDGINPTRVPPSNIVPEKNPGEVAIPEELKPVLPPIGPPQPLDQVPNAKIRDTENATGRPPVKPTETVPVPPTTDQIAKPEQLPATVPEVKDPNAPPRLIPNQQGMATNNNGENNTGNGGTVTTPVVPPKPPEGNSLTTNRPPIAPPPIIPTQKDPPIQAVDGAGVVGSIKGDGGEVRVTTGGAVTTVKEKDTIASGSTIETSVNAKVSIVLPGNGRLYVERGSTLTISFARTTTNITLSAGEIYYIAPLGGSLTLTSLSATASKVKEADIGLNGGRLTVANINEGALDLTARKQPTLHVAYGAQGGVAADGSDAPKLDPKLTQLGPWRVDVLLPGDSVKEIKKNKRR